MLGIDQISSERKELGMQKLMEAMPSFLKKRRPSLSELRILHRLSTYGAEVNGSNLVKIEKLGELFGHDESFLNFAKIFGAAGLAKGESHEEIAGNLVAFAETEGVAGKRVKINTSIRGHLRRAGIVLDQEESPHQVYMPNVNANPPYGLMLGLDRNVDTVLAGLCAKYDEIIATVKNPNDFLRVQAFFQIIGAAFIHPFADANGRAFESHFVVELNRKGLPVETGLRLATGQNLFSLLNVEAVNWLFQAARIPNTLTPEQVNSILGNKRERDEYMRRMELEIRRVIDEGISPSGAFYPFWSESAQIIGQGLRESGLI